MDMFIHQQHDRPPWSKPHYLRNQPLIQRQKPKIKYIRTNLKGWSPMIRQNTYNNEKKRNNDGEQALVSFFYSICLYLYPPLFLVDSQDDPGSSSVFDLPLLRLRPLDPALGHVKGDVDAAAQGACRQAQSNLHSTNTFKLLFLCCT